MRFNVTLLLSCSLFTFLFWAGELSARGCSCLPERPPCEAFWQAKAVFEGEVAAVAFLDQKGEETTGRHGEGAPQYVRARFVVRTAYRGVEGDEVDVYTGLGGGDCGYGFEKGARYLVYAHASRDGTNLSTGICSRTRPIEEAAEDLAYIKSASSARGGRIFGSIREYGYDTSDRYAPVLREALAGVTVVATLGDRRVSATSNGEGAFEIQGLETGTYSVTFVLPDGMAMFDGSARTGAPVEVELIAPGCKEVGAAVGRVSLGGTVLDEHGRPTEENVYLISVDDPEFQLSVISGEDGRFAIVGAPAGRYRLATGVGGVLTVGRPHPESYHPGVPDPERATVFVVGGAGAPRDVVLRLPAPIPQVTLTGVALWPDGRPAAGVEIKVEEATAFGSSRADYKTDAGGRFSFPALENGEYKVYAEHRFGGDGLIRSPSVVVKASAETAPIRLTVGADPPPDAGSASDSRSIREPRESPRIST